MLPMARVVPAKAPVIKFFAGVCRIQYVFSTQLLLAGMLRLTT